MDNVQCRGKMFITLPHYMYVTRCAIVGTMCVQNYAGSRIESDSFKNCCSDWHATCLRRYSHNKSTDTHSVAQSAIAEPVG